MIGLYRFYSVIYTLVVLYRTLFFIHQRGWTQPLLLLSFIFCLFTLTGIFVYICRVNLKKSTILNILPFTTLFSELYFLWEAWKVSPRFALLDLALTFTAVYTIFLFVSRLPKTGEKNLKESKETDHDSD